MGPEQKKERRGMIRRLRDLLGRFIGPNSVRAQADRAVERSKQNRRRVEQLLGTGAVLLVALALAACSSIEPGVAAANARNVATLVGENHQLAVRAGVAEEAIRALDARNAIFLAHAEDMAARAEGR